MAAPKPQPSSPTPHHVSPRMKVIMLVFAVLLVAALGWFVWVSNADPGATDYSAASVKKNTITKTIASKETKIDEATFSLTLPEGWSEVTEEKIAHTECDGSSKNYYQDTAGNYFDVCVDPLGRGVSVDQSWVIKKNGSGFSFVSASELCDASDESGHCGIGNSKLEVLLKAEDNLINSHYYYFQTGNEKKETGVDTAIFKTILASFKAN